MIIGHERSYPTSKISVSLIVTTLLPANLEKMNSGDRDQAAQDPTAVLAANDSKDIAPRNFAVTRFRTKYVNKPKMDSYLDGQLGKGKYEVSVGLLS